MDEFAVGLAVGILFCIGFRSLINTNPWTWTPKNTPLAAAVYLNFREVDDVLQATIFRLRGKMCPKSGPGYVVQFTGFDPETKLALRKGRWGWVQIVLPEK